MSYCPINVVILTYNEEMHIERCINSAAKFADTIYVVDSFSTDDTCGIARQKGCEILQHEFKNHADQFNWCLRHLPQTDSWIFRLDADEIVTDQLAVELNELKTRRSATSTGYTINRSMYFLGRKLRYGAVANVKIVRLFKAGEGRCENRLMDEHIVVSGTVGCLSGDLYDYNLNSLSWWIQKHDRYSTNEALQRLIDKREPPAEELPEGKHWSIKRIIKLYIFNNLPIFLGPLLLFLYRYIFRLGFMDGREGLAYHFFQSFWYRFLVEIKFQEISEQRDG